MAIDRLKSVTDDDIDSGYRLLQPGIREAEAILVKAQSAEKSRKKPKRRQRPRRLGLLQT